MSKVLIVDDAAFMRIMLKNILTKEGYETFEASTATEAIERYPEVRPDVVTMDITMPDMDGISAMREIIRIDPTARVVICSAHGQQRMVFDALAAGAKDFIVKPFRPDRVVEALVKATRAAR